MIEHLLTAGVPVVGIALVELFYLREATGLFRWALIGYLAIWIALFLYWVWVEPGLTG